LLPTDNDRVMLWVCRCLPPCSFTPGIRGKYMKLGVKLHKCGSKWCHILTVLSSISSRAFHTAQCIVPPHGQNTTLTCCVNLYALGFKWLQSTFMYVILFARHLNFSTFFTKKLILQEPNRVKLWIKQHFLGNKTEIFLCVFKKVVIIISSWIDKKNCMEYAKISVSFTYILAWVPSFS